MCGSHNISVGGLALPAPAESYPRPSSPLSAAIGGPTWLCAQFSSCSESAQTHRASQGPRSACP